MSHFKVSACRASSVLLASVFTFLWAAAICSGQADAKKNGDAASTSVAPADQQASEKPVQLTAAQDHQRIMELLHMDMIRPGRNGSNPQAPNYANYDEAKANPYPTLPDALVLKNGQPVTTADMWRNLRRPEIVEDFDREVYGRVPKETPNVNWEVTNTTNGINGNVPTITKTIVGHVDNSSYPAITVNIGLTLTVPANATGPVPVMMVFGGGFGGGFGRGGAAKGAAAPGGSGLGACSRRCRQERCGTRARRCVLAGGDSWSSRSEHSSHSARRSTWQPRFRSWSGWLWWRSSLATAGFDERVGIRLPQHRQHSGR